MGPRARARGIKPAGSWWRSAICGFNGAASGFALLLRAIQARGQVGYPGVGDASARGRPEGGGQGQTDRAGGRRQDEMQGVHQAFSLGAGRALSESLGPG